MTTQMSTVKITLNITSRSNSIYLVSLLIRSSIITVNNMTRIGRIIMILKIIQNSLINPSRLIMRIRTGSLTDLYITHTKIRTIKRRRRSIVIISTINGRLIRTNTSNGTAVKHKLHTTLRSIKGSSSGLNTKINRLNRQVRTSKITSTLGHNIMRTIPILKRTLKVLSHLTNGRSIHTIKRLNARLSNSMLRFRVRLYTFLFTGHSNENQQSKHAPQNEDRSLPEDT